jgi:hypothetical protein
MPRRIAAVGAAALAVLLFTPGGFVTALTVGPASIGVGARASAWAYAITGLVQVLQLLLIVVLVACAPGLWAGRRRAGVTATVAALVAAGLVWVIPSSGAWWVPVPRISVGVVAFAVVVPAVVIALRPGARAAGRPWGRWVALAIAVVAVFGGVLGAVRESVPSAPHTGPAFVAGPAWETPAQPMDAPAAPQNPWLAPGQGSTIHNDAWMTDAYTGYRLPDPRTAATRSFFAGGDCASILFSPDDRVIALCVSPVETRLHVLTPDLRPLMSATLFRRPFRADFATNFSAGGYAVLDRDGHVLTPAPDGRILKLGVTGSEVARVAEYDVAASLQQDEAITSVLPDWSGALWFVGREGTVGVVDPVTGISAAIAFDGADIENSFALVDGGGAFVATSRELLRLAIEGGRPVVVWSQEYDAGSRRKPGQTSRATGTTPTVFAGGDLVTITDNADPRMNVLVFDARANATNRLLCAVPVFADGASATDNSLIAMGSSLFVENNYGYGLLALSGGRISTPGLARIDVDLGARRCSLAWSNDDIVIPSVVSKGVALEGKVLTYTKTESVLGEDLWWFTAVDAATGEVAWQRLAGSGPLFNNHYAAIYASEAGAVYVGTVAGVAALLPAG